MAMATIADDLTTPRSVDPTGAEIQSPMSIGRLLGRIGESNWWLLSPWPAFAAQGLDHLIARLLAHTQSVPA
jgi:hypothetical protein